MWMMLESMFQPQLYIKTVEGFSKDRVQVYLQNILIDTDSDVGKHVSIAADSDVGKHVSIAVVHKKSL